MPYTREDFQAAGIDPDSREAYEINQAAEEELARQDPTYGTQGKHSTGIIPRMLPDDFWKIPLIALGAGTAGEYLSGLGGASPAISGTATGSASGYSSALPVGLIEGATPGATIPGLSAAPLSSIGAGGAGAGAGAAAAPAVSTAPSGAMSGVSFAPGASSATTPMAGVSMAPAASSAAAPAAAAAPATAAATAPAWQGPQIIGSTGKGAVADLATGGTPMAMWKKLLIGGGIGAAGDLVQGYFQSKAADKALKAEQEATDKALALRKEQYDTARADLAPYRGVGGGAIGTLGALMGIPQGGGGAPLQPSANPTAPVQPQQPVPMMKDFLSESTQGVNTKASRIEASQKAAAARTQSGMAPGGMVNLRSPDGSETKQVPANQVDWWVSQGATRL